jgi:hypothetical protein
MKSITIFLGRILNDALTTLTVKVVREPSGQSKGPDVFAGNVGVWRVWGTGKNAGFGIFCLVPRVF